MSEVFNQTNYDRYQLDQQRAAIIDSLADNLADIGLKYVPGSKPELVLTIDQLIDYLLKTTDATTSNHDIISQAQSFFEGFPEILAYAQTGLNAELAIGFAKHGKLLVSEAILYDSHMIDTDDQPTLYLALAEGYARYEFDPAMATRFMLKALAASPQQLDQNLWQRYKQAADAIDWVNSPAGADARSHSILAAVYDDSAL